jgi:hypothetical protein
MEGVALDSQLDERFLPESRTWTYLKVPGALASGELESVTRIAIHATITVGRTLVAESNHDLVYRLWILG